MRVWTLNNIMKKNTWTHDLEYKKKMTIENYNSFIYNSTFEMKKKK